MQEKDVYKMFTNKKIRVVVSAICAVMTMMTNVITPIAAPYGLGNAEDVRNKALSNYLSANKIISMVSAKAPSVITDVLVTYKNETVVESVNYTTVKRLNASLKPGETVTVREGVNGEKIVTYNVKYENGVEVSREATETIVVKEPVIKVVEYGAENPVTVTFDSSADYVDTSTLNYSYYIDCEATAYDLSPEENGGYGGQSATGVPLDKGVIAVDPRVIPLGSRVYIEAIDGSWSYGYAVAADTGGAIKGKRVDLCYRTQYECIQFGRRACRVYILN